MSNFGGKLAELLERNHTRASELSRASKIKEALISRWITGRQAFVSVEDLATLSTILCVDSSQQAELIRAHLLDELGQAPGRELIEILIRQGDCVAKEDTAPSFPAMPLKMQRAFQLIMQESQTDPDVRQVVLGLAATLGRQPVSAAREPAVSAPAPLPAESTVDGMPRRMLAKVNSSPAAGTACTSAAAPLATSQVSKLAQVVNPLTDRAAKSHPAPKAKPREVGPAPGGVIGSNPLKSDV